MRGSTYAYAMSTSSMVTVSSTVNMMMQPVASVMSRVLMAETVRRPIPGQEKTVSIAQQIAQRRAEHRDNGDQCVFQRVLADDHFFADALGAGGAKVVLPDHVQHGGAGDTGQAAGLTGAQRKGRQDQMNNAAALLI